MPMSYSEEVLDRLMKGHADVVNNYVARRNKLEDISSERQYEQTAAGEASKRRMAEYTEQERQRLIQKYAEMGVSVKGDDSIEQANSKFRAFQENRAGNMLDSYTGQLKQNSDDKQSVISNLQQLASKQADPLVQREALTMTLSNPAAVKDVPLDRLQKLKAVLNGPGDPAKVVQRVYDEMQRDYWFRKGAAQNKASAFYQTYLTELNSRLDKSKQIDASILMNRLNDLDKSGQDILHQRDLHIVTAAPFLSKEQIKNSHDTHPIAPPANPADAFGPTPAGPMGPPSPDTGAVNPPPPPTAAGVPPPPVPGLGERAVMKVGDAVSGMADNSAAYFSGAGGGPSPFVRDITGTGGREDFSPAPSAADVQANRSRIDATLKPIVPSNPAEAQAVKQLALSMGVSQQEIDTADQHLQNGTAPPTTVKNHNMLIMMVRRQQMGMPGSSGMTNMPPAGPIPAQ